MGLRNTDEVNNGEEMSLKDLMITLIDWYRYMISKWLIIVIFCLMGGILGYFYANRKLAEYIAVTTFVLDDGGGGGGSLGALSGLASMAGVDMNSDGGSIFQGDNILELYKSRAMIQKALFTSVEYDNRSELLVDVYLNVNGIRKRWDSDPNLKNLKFDVIKSDRLQDSVIGTIVADIKRNYLDVSKPDKKLSIIKAEVRAKDEFFAKTFNDLIVKNVNDFYVQTKTKKSKDNVAILQEKADSVRAVMNGAIYRSAAVSDATPNLNPTRQIQRIVPMQSSQFTAEANKAMLTELVKNLELSRMAMLKEKPLIQVIDAPVFPLPVHRLSKLIAVVVGVFLSGFMICLILVVRRFFKMALA